MKNLFYTILILIAFSFSIVLTSCCSDNECAELDSYGKTIVKQTDTIYNKTPKVDNGPYTVQIGAFANNANAEKFLKSAKSELKMDFVVKQTSDGLFRVVIGDYKTLPEAEEVLRNVKRKGYNDSFVSDSFGPIK
jgi:cell division protein FtsN